MHRPQDPESWCLSPWSGGADVGRREDLELMRVGLFEAFNSAPDTVKAQVAAQLRAVIKELDELPGVKVANPIDDQLAARRVRQANAKVS